jgi:hypothetical protein
VRADGTPLGLGLTLTHGHGVAAAWATTSALPGADLELVRPRPEGTFRFYLDEKERVPLLALAGAERDAAAIVLWALKEATWKTLRPPRGIGIIDFELTVADLRASSGEASVGLRRGALDLARERKATTLRAWFRREGDLVFAWASAEVDA